MTDFTWRDGERLIRFRRGAVDEAESLAAGAGLTDFALLTTERAAGSAPALVAAADGVVHVPPGKVDEVSAALLGQVDDRDLVALGGGRVIDTAKAIAGAGAAGARRVPTTLSGAEMTPFHRMPAGVEGAQLVRPALVVADPDLMASQPARAAGRQRDERAGARARGALHAARQPGGRRGGPAGRVPARRGAWATTRPTATRRRSARCSPGTRPAPAGFAVHHAVCQTIVRVAGTPHAQTNAVMLPHSARLMAGRAPAALGRLCGGARRAGSRPGAAAGRGCRARRAHRLTRGCRSWGRGRSTWRRWPRRRPAIRRWPTRRTRRARPRSPAWCAARSELTCPPGRVGSPRWPGLSKARWLW